MELKQLLLGVQHIGLPVSDIEKSKEFYKGLMFEEVYSASINGGMRVSFLRLENLVLELYEAQNVAGKAGAVDHIAIDVKNIEKVYDIVIGKGYYTEDSQINYLPFFSKGVRFFTIIGPNQEKIEFNEVLK